MSPRRLHNEPRRRALRARERHESMRRLAGRSGAGTSQVRARTTAQQAGIATRSPTRTIVISFALLCAVGSLLLMLPVMRTGGGGASPGTALFTAVSASTVTGLSVQDTSSYWTGAGQVTILMLIQIGGFGIQALGTLWILLLNRKLGTSSRLAAQAEPADL